MASVHLRVIDTCQLWTACGKTGPLRKARLNYRRVVNCVYIVSSFSSCGLFSIVSVVDLLVKKRGSSSISVKAGESGVKRYWILSDLIIVASSAFLAVVPRSSFTLSN